MTMKIRSLIDDKKRKRAMEAFEKNDPTLITPSPFGRRDPAQERRAGGKRAVPPEEQWHLDSQLAKAAVGDDIRGVMDALSEGANPNGLDADGETVLFRASNTGHMEVVKLLLRSGGDPNIGNSEGTTPLMCAASRGNYGMVKILLDAGADPNAARQNDGMTALLWAARNGHTSSADIILARGARINERRHDGKTALGRAIENGHAEMAEFLRSHGGKE